jgi:hypothetical protein
MKAATGRDKAGAAFAVLGHDPKKWTRFSERSGSNKNFQPRPQAQSSTGDAPRHAGRRVKLSGLSEKKRGRTGRAIVEELSL